MDNLMQLSRQLWNAMHEENISFLKEHIHENAVFVHMGVTLTRNEELEVIKEKKIVYQNIDIESVTTQQIHAITIILTKLKLTAVVDGNEVINPFVVTEVYTNEDMKLASLSYTRINY